MKLHKRTRTGGAWITAVVCGILLGTRIGLCVEPTATNGPRLVCDAPEFDYGRVVNTQEVEHTFLLRNTGDVEAVIGRIHSGCGCTRTQASATTIPPGGTGTVSVVINLRGRSGERDINVFVNSNDPVNPICSLRCRGTTYFSDQDRVTGLGIEAVPIAQSGADEPVVAGITVIPPGVVLVDSDAGRFPARYVMVRAAGQQPFRVLSIATEGVEDLVKIHQTGTSWVILRVGPLTARPAWKTATIRLTTDRPGFETISIQVILKILPS